MKCSVYIATSADGYIATEDGGVDWLQESGNLEVEMGSEDMGFKRFMDSVDCMIMGRKCMEKISEMNLTPDQWFYGDMPITVLSNTLKEPPENLAGKIEIYSGDIEQLIKRLENRGLKHAYIDGGSTITSFIKLRLINELIITQAPILLGKGIPLFGQLNNSIKLTNAHSIAYPNDFIQSKYMVSY